ncbi:unnamed protein product [Rotaria magnacalcarata]|uniref:Uncharacterized protein n=2 Tax=Rotaria magnacalcarata TaxID=392030 RepID=A0A820HAY0_9BILA|nr:unnamed protein product [Rotaria magnacalcarata]CAF4126867.1 unnamed protein product [Rotaria magnacalcarata]CAF4273334.1 unnamed protein product [Rotaria magnacalcarata]CAF4290590.1 unnamed protein product [Rotaria magnacalcarata]
MFDEDKEIDIYEINEKQKLLSTHSLHNQLNRIEQNILTKSEESLMPSCNMSLNDLRNNTNLTKNSPKIANLDAESRQNLMKSGENISGRSSQLSSFSNTKSTETTKSELIQRILYSFKPTINLKCSPDNTTDGSLSSINERIIPCQSLNLSNQIYIHFKDANELGLKPHINDLLERINCANKCTCHRIEINFNNHILNQELSYQQKQSILRIVLRRQQIFDQYFSQTPA